MTKANTTKEAQGQKNVGLSKDTIHTLLSNSRRRAVIRILDERGAVEKSRLSTLVAADEYDTGEDLVSSEERSRVHISLHQQHLDKMLDAGVIKSNGEITPTEDMEQLLWHLKGEPPDGRIARLLRRLYRLYR